MSGRYFRVDPIGYSSGGVNLFTYVSDNPISSYDRYGLSEEDCNKIVTIAMASQFVFDLMVKGCLGSIICACCTNEDGFSGEYNSETSTTHNVV